MSDLVERLKDVVSDRAGGSTSEPNYDPELLEIGFSAADRIEQLERVLLQAREALKATLNRDERNTCIHDDTHRGGAIWEICNNCGAKWADDEGGKPEWTDPPEWDAGYSAIASIDEALK